MTRHLLVRCPAQVLLDQAVRRHPTQQREPLDQVDPVASWLSWPSKQRRPPVIWRQRLPGNLQLRCCLEVEQGANGVLVHLSAVPATDPTWPPAAMVSRLAVEAWIARELTILARDAETVSRLNTAGSENRRNINRNTLHPGLLSASTPD